MDAEGRTAGRGPGFYQRTWRWWVLATLFLATFLNYLDRQTLSHAMSPIGDEFGLDNEAKGALLAAFLWTYAAAHLFVGFVLDRVKNIRFFFAAMVVGWSTVTVLTGLARDYNQLVWMRYLLGVFESVNFPLCIMIAARIFPAEERSLACGVFASGAFLANLIAPKFVVYISTYYDWRYSFILAGSLGVVWLLPWFLIFRDPEKRAANWVRDDAGEGGSLDFRGLGEVLRSPAFWGVALIGIGIIPSLYFITQWLPTCLEKSLNLEYDQHMANRVLLINLMLDGGLWIGGGLVLWLSKRHFSILASRKIAIVCAYFLMISILLLRETDNTTASIAIFCMFTLGIGMFLGNQHAFKQDVVKSRTATVAAWVGFIEMMFTAFVVQRVGKLIGEQADFGSVYLALAGLSTVALVSAFALLRPKWVTID